MMLNRADYKCLIVLKLPGSDVYGGKVSAATDLIFVTDITDYICGEKSVMWRNFRFLLRI